MNLQVRPRVLGLPRLGQGRRRQPAFFFNVENPTSGWGFGGSFLVDVVTAASTDIVATASPRWTEQRYVPALGGHKKFGDVDVNLHAAMSIEPDYLATSVGTTVAVDLKQKTITPSFSYDFSYDIAGRSGTSYEVFSRRISATRSTSPSSFVLDKNSILTTNFSAVIEAGDSSKPYRYIPMFTQDIAPRVLPGQSLATVNFYRNPERILEQLPLTRQRFALAGRYARRFSASTLRLEERLYADSWGLKASTTDMRYLVDVSKNVRVWPHFRFHAQTGADFWQLAYVAERTPTGLQVPALRTGDRELGPLLGVTGGVGTRIAFGEAKNWGLIASGDVDLHPLPRTRSSSCSASATSARSRWRSTSNDDGPLCPRLVAPCPRHARVLRLRQPRRRRAHHRARRGGPERARGRVPPPWTALRALPRRVSARRTRS